MDNLWRFKRTYIASDGDEYINMCIPSLDMTRLNANAFFNLHSGHSGRIDRFVSEYVSNIATIDDGIDHTMWCNHIFNPFAIEEGDCLYSPIVSSGTYVRKNEPSLPDGSKLSSNMSTKKQMTYAENVEYLATMGYAWA